MSFGGHGGRAAMASCGHGHQARVAADIATADTLTTTA